MSLRLAYSTNGFADHRLADALAVISGLGYEGVSLTLDHEHLDPFAPDAAHQVDVAARLLASHGLAVVIETGARYLLDPWHKHEPTLVSAEGRDVRLGLLHRAVDIAGDLGTDVVHLWSGILPPHTSPERGWSRLLGGMEELLPHAQAAGVRLAFEPEPGMFIERLDGVAELRQRLGSPEHLGTTVDVGHLRCNETASPAECLLAAADSLFHVQIDDMHRGSHEHLPFGEGEVNLPEAVGALERIGYQGLVSVELPRHSHAAPAMARQSMTALQAAIHRAASDEEST